MEHLRVRMLALGDRSAWRRSGYNLLKPLFTRHFSFLVLTSLTLCAYLQARGVSHLIGAGMLVGRSEAPAVPASTNARPAAQPPRSAAALIARNPFDSVRGSLLKPAHPPEPPEPEKKLDLSDPLRAPICDDIRVESTMVANDPMWSSAVLQTSDDKRGVVSRVGQSVDDMQVAYIGYNVVEHSPAVWLVDDRDLCQAVVFGDKPKVGHHRKKHKKSRKHAKKHKKKRAKKHKKKRTPRLPRSIARRIERVGSGQYVVERSAVESILENQQLLMRSVRIKPKRTKQGTRLVLSRVRKGSLLHEIGLRRGDEVESINGYQLASPEKALQAYARLRTADNLSVSLRRNGKPMTLDYRIQ